MKIASTYAIVYVATLLAADAQTSDSGAVRILAEPDPRNPAIVSLAVTNISGPFVSCVLTSPERDYMFSLTGQGGSEPRRTARGEALRRASVWSGSAVSVRLGPGESTAKQPVDLREFWDLGPGSYDLKISRVVGLSGMELKLNASTVITLPAGWRSNRACGAGAGQVSRLSRNAVSAPRGTAVRDELDRALDRNAGPAMAGPEPTFTLAFVSASMTAGIPGGMAISARGQEEPVCMTDSRTVRDVVGEVVAVRPELSVDWESSVVNLVDSRITGFLETKISLVEIPHPISDLSGAIDSVFSAPEMQARASALGMVDRRFKFPPLRTDGGMEIERSMRLENVTARQALNALAQRWGAGVWIYIESPFGDRVAYDVHFNGGVHRGR